MNAAAKGKRMTGGIMGDFCGYTINLSRKNTARMYIPMLILR